MTKARDNYGKCLAFIEDALQQETDECILWPFGLVAGRYPNIGHGQRAHRVICERKHGPPFAKAEAAHRCGVRTCVNHRHLYWATRQQNVADLIAHGGQARGEQIHTAKLTSTDVLAIRASSEGALMLSKRHGVSVNTIYHIRKRKSWGHI